MGIVDVMLCMNVIALAGSNAILVWCVWKAPTLSWARNALECMGSGGTYCTHTPAACWRGQGVRTAPTHPLLAGGGTYCTHTPAACWRGYVLHPHTRCLLEGLRTAPTLSLLAGGGTYCTHTPAACWRGQGVRTAPTHPPLAGGVRGYVLHPHTRCLLEGSGLR